MEGGGGVHIKGEVVHIKVVHIFLNASALRKVRIEGGAH